MKRTIINKNNMYTPRIEEGVKILIPLMAGDLRDMGRRSYSIMEEEEESNKDDGGNITIKEVAERNSRNRNHEI